MTTITQQHQQSDKNNINSFQTKLNLNPVLTLGFTQNYQIHTWHPKPITTTQGYKPNDPKYYGREFKTHGVLIIVTKRKNTTITRTILLMAVSKSSRCAFVSRPTWYQHNYLLVFIIIISLLSANPQNPWVLDSHYGINDHKWVDLPSLVFRRTRKNKRDGGLGVDLQLKQRQRVCLVVLLSAWSTPRWRKWGRDDSSGGGGMVWPAVAAPLAGNLARK